MDYEKALSKAREFYNARFATDSENEMLEQIFPELRESEDERIRKALIGHFRTLSYDLSVNGFTKEDFIAWLERQGEKEQHKRLHNNSLRHVDNPMKWMEEDTAEREQKPVIRDTFGYEEGRQAGVKEGVKMVLSNPEMHGLCKPAEWSSLDKACHNVIHETIRGKFVPANALRQATDWFDSLPERFNLQPKQEWSEEDESFLDSIEEAVSSYYDLNHAPQYYYWLEEKFKGLRSYPKQEWSEEDEKMREHLISDLREFRYCETDEELIEDYEDEIQWLQSLRPQPHWKPSSLELQALKTAIHILTEERNFPKAAQHLKDILDHFNGEETRQDWKPTEETMIALDAAIDKA